MVCGKLWFGKCLTAAVSDLFISYFYLALWFGKGPAAAVSDQFIPYCFTVSNTLECRLYVYPCCNSMRIVLWLFSFSFQIVKMSCVQSSSKAFFSFWEQVELVLLILLVAIHLDRKADICSFGAALENTSSKRFRHFFRLTPSTKTWKWAPPPKTERKFCWYAGLTFKPFIKSHNRDPKFQSKWAAWENHSVYKFSFLNIRSAELRRCVKVKVEVLSSRP